MGMDIQSEVAAMERLTSGELQQKYVQVFGEQSRSRHRQWLIRRIAWRLQAQAEGDLSERARRRAEELADIADARVTPPKTVVIPIQSVRTAPALVSDARLPISGTSITRPYKGRTLEVRVIDNGFEYAGERYKSLSAVARAITGSHVNGYRFFGLGAES